VQPTNERTDNAGSGR